MSVILSAIVLAVCCLPAFAKATLIVSTDGTGNYKTIREAIEIAINGDIISVSPGKYNESLIIKKSLTIRGEGNADDIKIVGTSFRTLEVANGDVRIENISLYGIEQAEVSNVSSFGRGNIIFESNVDKIPVPSSYVKNSVVACW